MEIVLVVRTSAIVFTQIPYWPAVSGMLIGSEAVVINNFSGPL